MKRNNSGETSSLRRVRSFLRDLDNGNASLDDAEEIREDLYELVERMERVQERLPDAAAPELSSDVGQLLTHLDNRKGLLQKFPFMKAASFL